MISRHSVEFAKEWFNGKSIIAVEIGVYKGKNALSILQNLNVEKLYLIDPFAVYDDTTSQMGKDAEFPNVELEARELLKDYEDKIVWIKKYSDDAVNDIPEADFIYIDGNHEYEFVKRDMKNYYHKVKKDGILAGHDIRSKVGVKKAFEEFIKTYGHLDSHTSKSDWWVLR